MISIRKTLCAGAALLMSAMLAMPAASQEFSESHLAVAKRAATASPLADEFDAVLPFLAQRVQSRLINLRPDLHEVISNTVQEVALRLTTRRADLDNAAALVFARAFTEEELTVIADFYTSETGKKFKQLASGLGRATLQTVENWSSRVSEELLDKSREELKKQGHEL